MHQLGQIYEPRCPGKLSLIKSLGLFNAAIVNIPSKNTKIKIDVFKNCRVVLHQAKAENQNSNLVERAEQVKNSINKFRSKVKTLLKKSTPQVTALHREKVLHKLKLNKISKFTKSIKKFPKNTKKIMIDISQFREKVLGKPPCEYAAVGMFFFS